VAVVVVIAAVIVEAIVVAAVVVEGLDGAVVLGVVPPAATVAVGAGDRGRGGGCGGRSRGAILTAIFAPILSAPVHGLADHLGPDLRRRGGGLGSGLLRPRGVGAARRERDGGEEAEGDHGHPGSDVMA
jgi:hypothetical protein